MFPRCINPSNQKSFFIFGARGTGKSTFLRQQWGVNHHYINLLLHEWESRYLKNPDLLISDLKALKPKPTWVVIDEIQKVPKLLDIVHELIESTSIKFALTGSSARKLKRGSANLLAGRAFQNTLFPLTYHELGSKFALEEVLKFGALPSVFELNLKDKKSYLLSYTQTYLKEEILQEQLIRNTEAFRNFLEVAAQHCGKIINFSNISNDVNADPKTIQSFFSVLEDTLVGYILPAYSRSIRKSVKLAPKFYFFDLGVQRALAGALGDSLTPRTSAYGEAFEHFLILEILKINSYKQLGYKLSHYNTSAGGEIDLVLSKGKKIIAIEIKSSEKIDPVKVRKLSRVAEGIQPTQVFYISQDSIKSNIENVQCLHWKLFLDFLNSV